MWLWRWGSPAVSCHYSKFGGNSYCQNIDIRFYNCHVTIWLKGHVVWLVLPSTLCYHPFNFGGSRSPGKEDIIFFIPISIPILISIFANYKHLAWTMCIWFEACSFCKLIIYRQLLSLYFVDHIFDGYLV